MPAERAYVVPVHTWERQEGGKKGRERKEGREGKGRKEGRKEKDRGTGKTA
jgi:hypothetical protein